MKPQKFYSNGKLLLTGEYLVLDGAMALAIPTRYGQSLTVEPDENNKVTWESFDANNKLWFQADFHLAEELKLSQTNNGPIADRLVQIINAARYQNPRFLTGETGFKVKTQMDFPRDWGLGSSSTLINNFSQWAAIDPYVLLEHTFGGSGYDIACAKHNVAITYQLEKGGRTIIERDFNPAFQQQLYFVFLNNKQNSRDGIATYQKTKNHIGTARSEIGAITNDMLKCTRLEAFQFLMQSHEEIISKIIKQPAIKDILFKDFEGSIKSLGAWGGDFILVAAEECPQTYFKTKGFETVIPYMEMAL